MILSQYTTPDEVRALLGVSSRELADTVIQLPHWTLAVEQELLDVDGGAGAVLTQFDTIYAIAAGSRTAAQTQFFKVLTMYVAYSMGHQLIQRADVFSPQNITDGKAAIQRLADRFDKLRPAIDGGMQRLLARVKDALLALNPSAIVAAATSRIMFASVGLGTDPVTGV